MATVCLIPFAFDWGATPEYRVTVDPTHAELIITEVPADIAPRQVARLANLTVLAVPFGTKGARVPFTRLGAGRTVNLYRRT